MNNENKVGIHNAGMGETESLRVENERLKKEIENIKFECAKEVFNIKTKFSEEIEMEYRSTLRKHVKDENYLSVFEYIGINTSQSLINKFGYDILVRVIKHLYQDYLLKELKEQAKKQAEEEDAKE